MKKIIGDANIFMCHRVHDPDNGYSLDEAKHQLAAHPHTWSKCTINQKGLMELAPEAIAVDVAEEFMSRETDQESRIVEHDGFKSVIYVLFPDRKTLSIVDVTSYVEISHVGNFAEGN